MSYQMTIPFETAPDVGVLERIHYPSDAPVQPAWIGERHPEYVHDHGMGRELVSIRTAEQDGHSIKITTSYEIEIDGESVHIHAFVDNAGRLRCHTTPYETYPSAVQLVQTLIARFPGAFHGEVER